MKKCVLVLASLALMLVFCLPAAAQPNVKAQETMIIDKFDTPDECEWTWKVQASRFVSKDQEKGIQYPILSYFNGIPNSLRPYHDNPNEALALGVKAKFDRKGENWFEVYPEYKDKTAANGLPLREIEFKGTVSKLDFWVWGAGYLYYLEAIVRDANGVVHVIPAGSLNFNGWRNVVLTVPTNIVQHSKLRSGPRNLTFVGFRVRADAKENVDDFVIYFDQLRYTTNTLANIYDGFDLKDADFGEDQQ